MFRFHTLVLCGFATALLPVTGNASREAEMKVAQGSNACALLVGTILLGKDADIQRILECNKSEKPCELAKAELHRKGRQIPRELNCQEIRSAGPSSFCINSCESNPRNGGAYFRALDLTFGALWQCFNFCGNNEGKLNR